MPSDKRKIGDLGEKIAGKWLLNKGFVIIDRNYLRKWGEIDIIAQKSGIHRFIEVKSMTSENLEQIKDQSVSYNPVDNVHPKKLQRLFRTIKTYLIDKNVENDWQLDIVTVRLDMNKKIAKVEILENIIS